MEFYSSVLKVYSKQKFQYHDVHNVVRPQ